MAALPIVAQIASIVEYSKSALLTPAPQTVLDQLRLRLVVAEDPVKKTLQFQTGTASGDEMNTLKVPEV